MWSLFRWSDGSASQAVSDPRAVGWRPLFWSDSCAQKSGCNCCRIESVFYLVWQIDWSYVEFFYALKLENQPC
jgi:hypothetical protein